MLSGRVEIRYEMEGEKMNNKPHEMIIVSVDNGEWQVMYVDGDMYLEDHSLSEMHFVSAIREYKNFETVERYEISEDDVEAFLSEQFPYGFHEIPISLLTAL